MITWFNVSNMKIYHSGRKSRMTEALLYIQKTLTIFQKMCCGTMTKIMRSDRMVEMP